LYGTLFFNQDFKNAATQTLCKVRPMSPSLIIEPLTVEHWDAVRSIYLQGIATGDATFQQTAPDWREWDEGHLSVSRIIARNEKKVVGWAALSAVSRRPVYAGVAEVSIYVAEEARGSGIGSELISSLIDHSEAAGVWTLQAGIFPENTVSLRLHKSAGFREVGLRSRVGCMHGRWRDVLLLERRSTIAGS
jgi:L-amino acid N-acyltransferase YncA